MLYRIKASDMKGEGKMVLMCCLKDTTLHLYLMQKVKKAGRAKIFRQIVGAFKVLCYNILNDITTCVKECSPWKKLYYTLWKTILRRLL